MQIQQNWALKILHNKDYHTPTKSIDKELNLLLVEDIYKIGVLKFVYKQKYFLLPNVFSQFYIENASIHSHNTRQCHGIHVINPTNKFGQRKIIYIKEHFFGNLIKHNCDYFTSKPSAKKVKHWHFISKYKWLIILALFITIENKTFECALA